MFFFALSLLLGAALAQTQCQKADQLCQLSTSGTSTAVGVCRSTSGSITAFSCMAQCTPNTPSAACFATLQSTAKDGTCNNSSTCVKSTTTPEPQPQPTCVEGAVCARSTASGTAATAGVCVKGQTGVACVAQCTDATTTTGCYLTVNSSTKDGQCAQGACSAPPTNPTGCVKALDQCAAAGSTAGGKCARTEAGALVCVSSSQCANGATGATCTFINGELAQSGVCGANGCGPASAPAGCQQVFQQCTLPGSTATGKCARDESGALKCFSFSQCNIAAGSPQQSTCVYLSGEVAKQGVCGANGCGPTVTPPSCAVDTACSTQNGAGKWAIIENQCTCKVVSTSTCVDLGKECAVDGVKGTWKAAATGTANTNGCVCVANPVPPACAVDTACSTQNGTGKWAIIENQCTCKVVSTSTCVDLGKPCTADGVSGTWKAAAAGTASNNGCVCIATPVTQCQGECLVGTIKGVFQTVNGVCKCNTGPVLTCRPGDVCQTAAGKTGKWTDSCGCVEQPTNQCLVGKECFEGNVKGLFALVGDACKCVPSSTTPGGCDTVGKECFTEAGAKGTIKAVSNSAGVSACVCVAISTTPSCTVGGDCINEQQAKGTFSSECKCVTGSVQPACRVGGECANEQVKGTFNADCKCVAGSVSTQPPPSKCVEAQTCALQVDDGSQTKGVCRRGVCVKFECQTDAECNPNTGASDAAPTGARVCQNFACVSAPIKVEDPCAGSRACQNGAKCVVVDAARAGLTQEQTKTSGDVNVAVGVKAAVCVCTPGFTGALCENKAEQPIEKEQCKCATGQVQREGRCVQANVKTCDCAGQNCVCTKESSADCTAPEKQPEPVETGKVKVLTVVFGDKASLLQALGLVQQLISDKFDLSSVTVTAEKLPAGADGKVAYRVTVSTSGGAVTADLLAKIGGVADTLRQRSDVVDAVVQDAQIENVDPNDRKGSAASLSLTIAAVLAAMLVVVA